MAKPLLSFVAKDVAADTIEYTPECVVYLIAFGAGDPEAVRWTPLFGQKTADP